MADAAQYFNIGGRLFVEVAIVFVMDFEADGPTSLVLLSGPVPLGSRAPHDTMMICRTGYQWRTRYEPGKKNRRHSHPRRALHSYSGHAVRFRLFLWPGLPVECKEFGHRHLDGKKDRGSRPVAGIMPVMDTNNNVFRAL